VQEASGKRALRLTVGISDALPKLIAYRLLQPVRSMPEKLSLVCHEGDFVDLVADLALHRLDVVLTDRPAAVSGSLRVYSHPLGECEISLFGTPALAANYRENFPGCLQGAPVLLPTRENALRGRLDQWFAANDLHLDLAGEFDDNALLTTFGGGGLGLFPAPAVLAADIEAQFGAQPVGALSGVREQFYAISAERRIRHPGVEAIQAGARGLL
jgi:LysR family transcriptional activator of nhaA